MGKAKRLQLEAEEEFRKRYGVVGQVSVLRGPAPRAPGPFEHAVQLGQVPLVLGPSSWGFPAALPTRCPPGRQLLEDGTCGP